MDKKIYKVKDESHKPIELQISSNGKHLRTVVMQHALFNGRADCITTSTSPKTTNKQKALYYPTSSKVKLRVQYLSTVLEVDQKYYQLFTKFLKGSTTFLLTLQVTKFKS